MWSNHNIFIKVYNLGTVMILIEFKNKLKFLTNSCFIFALHIAITKLITTQSQKRTEIETSRVGGHSVCTQSSVHIPVTS